MALVGYDYFVFGRFDAIITRGVEINDITTRIKILA